MTSLPPLIKTLGVDDDPYISEDMLGTGPSGKVYRGHDVAGSSLVRIKALLTDGDVGCAVDRDCIRAAVPALLNLWHPHVCRLVALDENSDDIALVSELSPGEPLTRMVTHHVLSAMDVRALASQLVMALQAGEALGIRHGDVKPSNVIVAAHPGGGCTLQLQDWGVADCRAQQPNETLCFRAPERLSGAPASAQSDLFSAGATLAVMLLGRPPVHGETPEQLFGAWASFDPMLLRHARPDVDSAFHDWLAWLLRFDPAYRPVAAAQAQDLLAAGTMMAYIPPMMPMYQMPVMQPWQADPAPSAPIEPARTETKNLGPVAAKPRPPTTALTKPKAEAAPAVKQKMKIPFGIIFSLSSLLFIGCFMAWLMSQWGPEWPQHLREMLGLKSEVTAGVTITKNVETPLKGQFVRIEIPAKATLNLAEVEVFSSAINIAQEGKATAKDTDWGGDPKSANDGKTTGDWGKHSIYHSKDDTDTPWWELDLGGEKPIEAVQVWNRTDKYASRLNNYSVIIFDKDRKEVWRADKQPTPKPSARHEVKR